MYVHPLLVEKTCHLNPPPHVAVSHRGAIESKAFTASVCQEGEPSGGSGKPYSRADRAEKVQKAWSSLPCVVVSHLLLIIMYKGRIYHAAVVCLGKEVVVCAGLGHHGLHDNIIEARIVRVGPVVDEAAPYGSSLPPI